MTFLVFSLTCVVSKGHTVDGLTQRPDLFVPMKDELLFFYFLLFNVSSVSLNIINVDPLDIFLINPK